MNHIIVRTDVIKLICGMLLILALTGCSEEHKDPATDNRISRFILRISEKEYEAAIGSESIVVTVPRSVSLTGARADVTLGDGATIQPLPAEISDWGDEILFSVTAENGDRIRYLYTVERAEVVISENAVILATPLEMEEFANSGITYIEGSLVIGSDGDEEPITSLLPLANLTGVAEELVIKKSVTSSDLLGLENLEYAGSIQIPTTSEIRHINLPSLRCVEGSITLPSTLYSLTCPLLEKVGGALTLTVEYTELFDMDLHHLEEIAGNFSVAVSSIPSGKEYELYLPALVTIEGTFTPRGDGLKIAAPELSRCASVAITASDGISSIYLPKLTQTGALQLSSPKLITADFPALESCTGMYLSAANIAYLNFPSLKTVSGNLQIIALPIKDFSPFSSLETVTGDLTIQAMASVSDLAGFESLRSVGGVFTVWNVDITELASLPALENVGKVVLQDLRQLQTLDRIGKLVNIPYLELQLMSPQTVIDLSSLVIEDLKFSEMEDISLTAPETVSGTLTLQTCENLTVCGLKRAGAVTVSGTGRFELPSLEKVEGNFRLPVTTTSRETSARLPLLSEVGGDFTVPAQNQKPLGEQGGVFSPSIRKVGGTLSITGGSLYYGFIDLDFLETLTSASAITVTNQKNLRSFEGLKGVLGSVTEDKWTCSGNLYNPSYSDLVDSGKWTDEDLVSPKS
ncbi:MAG: hypothetical protein LIO77_01450 [Rikenellaceae bacterium]|nr:hypothetical protein [Rikenellaceae bacterium]